MGVPWRCWLKGCRVDAYAACLWRCWPEGCRCECPEGSSETLLAVRLQRCPMGVPKALLA
jgi:hypothetical protein